MESKKYSVTELTNQIKNLLEGNPNLKNITLKGEISTFTRHFSGHLYFTLKDETSQIKGIMFKSNADRLNFNPKNGDKVEVRGQISVYGPQGSYSIQVSTMKEEGEGELYLRYLELKKSLKELGWFDKAPKPIPKYPKRIGVVTSSTGAVIQDIINTVNRRYKLTEVILYPAPVQGKGANIKIAEQIKRANAEKIVDILIVGRGGGSMEDLWEFNEMAVIDAIYNSKLPVITAIGHETDNSLSDLVSDLRAPTPTAAAEIATPNQLELSQSIISSYRSILSNFKNVLITHQAALINLSERLEQSSPLAKIDSNKNELTNARKLLNYYYIDKIKSRQAEISELSIKLRALNPASKLKENLTKINSLEVKLKDSYYYKLRTLRDRYKLLTSKVKSPLNTINSYQRTLDHIINNLNVNYSNLYTHKVSLYNYQLNSLEKINPLAIMKRGFAIMKDADNNIIESINPINTNDLINIELIDGILNARVIKKERKDK